MTAAVTHVDFRTGRRVDPAWARFLRACQLDEDPATLDEAERLYLEALTLNPKLDIAITNLGNIEHRRGRLEAALELYHRALDQNPLQGEAHFNLGYVLLKRGSARAAIDYFEVAARLRPDFPDAHFYLALCLEGIGRHDRARPSWLRFLELEPDSPWAGIARRHLPGADLLARLPVLTPATLGCRGAR